jgi:hypothetical protein
MVSESVAFSVLIVVPQINADADRLCGCREEPELLEEDFQVSMVLFASTSE